MGSRDSISKKRNRTVTICKTVGLIVLPAIVSGLVLSSNFTFAADNDVVDIIGTIVPVSCSMSTTGMDSHNTNIFNGMYVPNIGTSTMKITCNDSDGFSIYATGFTGNESGGTNSNKLVGTAISNYSTIETGTATSAGDPDVSNWAMKLAVDTQATYPITLTPGYENYHVVPNTYTKVATRLSATDVGVGAAGATMTTTYAAYVSGDQTADTYTGLIKYILLHPNTETMDTFYGAFTAADKVEYKGYFKMQDMNSSICANVSNLQTTTLIDARDDSTYTVAKIAGACWMTQNLRITGTVSSEGSNFSTYESVNVCEADLASGNSHDAPRCHDSGDPATGVWYNFAAASAKTKTGSGASGAATEDICPAGWHLPSYDTSKSAGSINSLTGDVTIKNAFLPVTGGSYDGGAPIDTSSGFWLSASSSGSYGRGLEYSGGSLSAYVGNGGEGDFIRCVRE